VQPDAGIHRFRNAAFFLCNPLPDQFEKHQAALDYLTGLTSHLIETKT
jgi:hypothetical protein